MTAPDGLERRYLAAGPESQLDHRPQHLATVHLLKGRLDVTEPDPLPLARVTVIVIAPPFSEPA